MYDSCEIHELQGLKCVKSPMEQKHLHFPGGWRGALGTWKVRSCTYYTCKVCNLTPSCVVCKYNVPLWYKLFKAAKHGSEYVMRRYHYSKVQTKTNLSSTTCARLAKYVHARAHP